MAETDKADLSRRRLLGLAAGAGAALASRGGAAAELVAGAKFLSDGRVAPWSGNTVVCHLPQQGPDAAAFEALLDGYRSSTAEPRLAAVTLLPPSSYHMTLYGGANDLTRDRGDWPTYVAPHATMAACDAAVAARMRRLRLGLTLPIRMRVDPEQGALQGDALQVGLLPFDAREAEKLAAARQALARAFDLRVPRTAPYRFHVSIGYVVRPLSAAERRSAQDVVVEWSRRLASRAPVIMLGAPEFCAFEDMFHFRRVTFIR